MRGRRRVGKSRLVEEFLSRAGVPHVYFTASTRSTGEELRLFAEEVRGSSLPGADLFESVTLTSWDGALRLLGAALPENGPSVVIIDELPYLTRSDPAFEGTLQKVFDRELSRRRMLFIGVGSDLAMMEASNGHGRPFYQRATEMVVPPLSPAEVAAMLKLDPANGFDAYLVTGGLPLILDEWKPGASLWEYSEAAVASPTSALLVSAERALAAEFPAELQALEVLTAIGSGERTFTNIGRAAGIAQPSLARALGILKTKRVVVAELPLSTRKSNLTRYQVAIPTCASGWPSLGRICLKSNAAEVTVCSPGYGPLGPHGADERSNPSCAKPWTGSSLAHPFSVRASWAATGPVRTTQRSTLSSPTANPSPNTSSESGPSNGLNRHPLTAATSPASSYTARSFLAQPTTHH